MKYINFFDHFPHELLTTPISKLHDFLKGPSLFRIEGEKDEGIFISTLLHGNETSGVLALNRFLKPFQNKKPPLTLYIFYGNTLAASLGQRHLPNQPDWNRIWATDEIEDSYEKDMALELLDYVKNLKLRANIDIHNNTGNNPPYGCINKIAPNFLKLASIFDEKIIYFTEPHEVQSMIFANFCPSMTIEAGLPGEEQGIKFILHFLEKLIKLDDFEALSVPKKPDIYHTIAKITIPKNSGIDFTNNLKSFNDFSLRADLENLNFQDIPVGTFLGKAKIPFHVTHHKGHEIFDEFFELIDGELKTKKKFTPSMLTKDEYVIKEDCLFYVMEPIKNIEDFYHKYF